MSMHARHTPSRPRRNTSRPTALPPTLSTQFGPDRTQSNLFGCGAPDASPDAQKRVDTGTDGWTPKIVKEMVLTPAHIRRANTFDPGSSEARASRRSDAEAKGTPTKSRSKSPGGKARSSDGGAYQLNIADAGLLIVIVYAAWHLCLNLLGARQAGR